MEIQKKWRVWGIVFLCLILLSLSLNFGIILFKIKIIENLNKNVNVLNPLSSKKNNFLNELETHLGVLKEDLVALKMKSDVKEREFEVEIPETWEMINYDNNDASNDMQKKVIHLQPKDDVNFIDAVVIKKDDDYNDFIALTLREKKSLFSNLAIIDEYDFLGGYMIYFTNVIDSVEVPTVLILTKDNIYRAAFNINNKMLSNYFTYRNDFENFIYTFRQL